MRRFGSFVVLTLAALTPAAALAGPQTLDKPGKKIRCLSLAEARAIALEHGTVGQPSLLYSGAGPGIAVPKPEDETIGKNYKVLASGKSGSKSIVISGIPHGRRRAEIERNLNQLLLNIENAYWNLYGSYWQLHSREQGLRFAYETWKITQAQYKVGRVSQAAAAQAEGQYNLFRSQRLQALDTVLDNERQLRAMMGIAIKDGTRLVPSDAPTLVEQKPDWKEGFDAAMKHRPELRMSRQDIKQAVWNVKIAKEEEEYIPSSNGVRQAQLQLARARLVLNDQELKTERFLGLYYRRMSSAYFQIKAARAQREAFATQLQIRYELYRAGAHEPGTDNPVTLNLLLEAQRFWSEALATEYQAIVTYNNSLAGWQYAKGSIRKYAHVRLAEAAPDDSDAVRASVREHKRTRQHVRHELTTAGECGNDSKAAASSLPALWKQSPLLKDAGEVQTGLIKGQAFNLN